jgi:serine phosphatase RsbU (regulator of sigma subunit)/ligand-binding sensor domain-containing protein
MAENDIAQDAQGFIWIGTNSGVCQYNGFTFNVYTNDNKNNTSLSDHSIRKLFCDSNGNLWIGTGMGLNRWQPEYESFERFYVDSNSIGRGISNVITDMAEDKAGNLWLGGFGLHKFNPRTKLFEHFYHDSSDSKSISDDSILAVYVDKENTLWVGTPHGLDKYNATSHNFTRYNLTKSKFNNSSNHLVSKIFEDFSGRIFIGGGGCNLYYFNRENGVIESLQKLKKNSIQIWAPKLIKQEKGIFVGKVTSIFQSPSTKEYWISVGSAGINRFDSAGHFIKRYGNIKAEENELNGATFTDIFEDRSNTLWFITNDNGIYRATFSANNFLPGGYGMPKLNKLFNKHIISLLGDDSNNLWLGTIDGILYKYNIASKSLSEYGYNTANPRGLGRGDINFIFKDNKNNIWVGTRFGLSLYLRQSDTFRTFFIGFKNENLNNFVSMIQDSTGNLLAGIWNWNLSKTKYYTFIPDKIVGNSYFAPDSNFGKDMILTDSQGKIKIIPIAATGPYQKHLLSATEVIEDKNGIIWIGSADGLFGYNSVNNNVISLTTKEGFPVNNIGGILIDDEDNFWIGTSIGLIKLNPDHKIFVEFSKENGLKNNLFSTSKAVFKSKSGLLFFGGTNGLTVIDPKRFNANLKMPYVQLTDFKIFGKSVPISENGILNKSISVSKQIELSYNQNDITLEYIGLHYKDPKKNRYEYKLEPYETVWNQDVNNRSARYTDLSPGKYKFIVRASNSDGIWDEEGRTLSIIINAPPWATWWAYTVYLVLAIGLLYFIRRFELNIKLKNAKIQESLLRAETSELQAEAAEAQSRLIKVENERKTKELEEARQIQLSMLPKELPVGANFEIAVYMKTATEVGGDYYDFAFSEDGTAIFGIGDATGHGMQAGTLVALMKGLFTSEAASKGLLHFFKDCSNAIKKIDFGRLMMAFSLIRLNGNLLQYSSAGMPPMYIYRNKLKRIYETDIQGMPLGAIMDFDYQLFETELNQGDCMLLFSDGFPELSNTNDQQYGYDTVKEQFARVAEKGPEEIKMHFINIISEWINDKDPEDDITFIVIKIK